MDQAPTPTTAATMPSQPVEKKRYEWIDNARVVAAILIMYIHWSWRKDIPDSHDYDYLHNFISLSTLIGRVPFFLILAGYFLSRNITRKKAFDRALWLFIPFCILNYLFQIAMGNFRFSPAYLTAALGIRAVFSADLLLAGKTACAPAIIASWFLRDIVVLSLLTPLLTKIKPLLILYILTFACLSIKLPVGEMHSALLNPYTCLFYFLGVCLGNFKIRDVYHILNPKFTPICFVLFILTTLYSIICVHHKEWAHITVFAQVLGALMIAHSGVLIETHLPKLSKRLSPCGPACFLVFMLHGPAFELINSILPKSVIDSWLGLFIPIPLFFVIIALFFCMKRYTPFLLPYLAHMKAPKK